MLARVIGHAWVRVRNSSKGYRGGARETTRAFGLDLRCGGRHRPIIIGQSAGLMMDVWVEVAVHPCDISGHYSYMLINSVKS